MCSTRANSISAPASPKLQRVRHVSNSTNFLRFGTPSDTIVHVPVAVARFNEKAQRDLARFHYNFDNLLHKNQLKRVPPVLENKEEYLTTIKSVNLPISSFSQVSRGRVNFCISPKDLTDTERIRFDIKRRVKSQVYVEPKMVLGKEAERSRAVFRQSVEKIREFGGGGAEEARNVSSFKAFGGVGAQDYFDAVKNGNLNAVEQFLSHDKRLLFSKDSIGQTSLHWAAKRNDLQLARVLRVHGADLNATDIALRTPLYIAARRDHTDMVLFLIDAGADRKVISLDGTTAGDVAKEGGIAFAVLNRKGLGTSGILALMDPRRRRSIAEMKESS